MSRALALASLTVLAAALTGCPVATPVAAGSPSPAATASASASMHPTPDPNASVAVGTAGKVYTVATDPAPYPLPPDTLDRIHAAGIVEKPYETLAYHVHAHLQVFRNGEAVVVPGLVGIDRNGSFISPLHTHSADGIVHIEAPQKTDFKLSQFLTEWGVSPVGFTGYVNGRKQEGDAGNIILGDQLEIVLVYGTPPEPVPAGYPASGPGPSTTL